MFQDIYPEQSHNRYSKLLKNKFFWLIIIVLIIFSAAFVLASRVFSFGEQVYPEKNIFEAFGSMGQLIVAGDRPLAEEASGEINLLLLGVGGNGYYGNILADTILLISIRPGSEGEATEVAMLSIPRDLDVDIPGATGLHKINEAYKYGELFDGTTGDEVMGNVIKEWTGIDIDYYAVMNFDGFRDAVDAIGGIEVDVERVFEDHSYPDNLATQYIRFEEGMQHMDGERALQYARSRKGTNGEGSDFARVRRQQRVVGAFRDKLRDYENMLTAGIIGRIAQALAENLKTDLEPWQAKRLYDLTSDVSVDQAKTSVLDPRTGIVCSAIDEETQLYVLRLCEGKTFDDVHEFSENRFISE